MIRGFGLVLLLAFGGAGLWAQSVSVPFVGCESVGQTENSPAPEGKSRSLPLSLNDARVLAYYASADGIGVLAPRGWHCEGVSGSGRYALYLSPKAIKKPFEGPVIEVDHTTNENGSGMTEIAGMIGRLFPAYREAAKREWKGILDTPFPARPYPKDALVYKSKTVVEFRTPPLTKGLGTAPTWLRKNGSPVSGVVMLPGDPPEMVQLAIRLPPELAWLASAIIREAERSQTLLS
jgi:hypothetical protein